MYVYTIIWLFLLLKFIFIHLQTTNNRYLSIVYHQLIKLVCISIFIFEIRNFFLSFLCVFSAKFRIASLRNTKIDRNFVCCELFFPFRVQPILLSGLCFLYFSFVQHYKKPFLYVCFSFSRFFVFLKNEKIQEKSKEKKNNTIHILLFVFCFCFLFFFV